MNDEKKYLIMEWFGYCLYVFCSALAIFRAVHESAGVLFITICLFTAISGVAIMNLMHFRIHRDEVKK